jgi:hypothetical protein
MVAPNKQKTGSHLFLLQSSSASRFTADASGFFILSQWGERLIGFGWKARRDEPGREDTLRHNAHR